MDKRCLCIVHMSLAFMLIFTAFQTQGNMQEVVIDSIHKEDPSFNGSGYISLAIIYAAFAVCNWFSPSVLAFLGPKLTMILGGITYIIFIISFLWPHTLLLYATSVVVGIGAAFLWPGQGNYLALMSDDQTIGTNSGIFWSIFQCSFLFGNLFVFYEFHGQSIIGIETRHVVFGILTAIGAVGVFILCFLPKPGGALDMGRKGEIGSPSQEFRKAFILVQTKEMQLLSITGFYSGIELSFFSGVYSSCISFTVRFEDAKRLVGLSGILIGIGEILGGALFGIFGKKTIQYGRDPIILLGYVVHIICFFLIFMNLPSSSPLGDTKDPSYLPYGMPVESLALLCSFLLGFGDACYNTQLYSIIGSKYANNSGPAFAIFKFTQSIAAAACFFYASFLQLTWHLLILVIFATFGTIAFFLVEWGEQKKSNLLILSDDDEET